MVVEEGSRKAESQTIVVDGEALTRVEESKYLGYVVNEKLSLARSGKHQERQCRKSYYVFKQQIAALPPTPPFSVAEKIFDVNFTSIINFCAEVFGPKPKLNTYQHQFFTE